jgi:hypothetical protein
VASAWSTVVTTPAQPDSTARARLAPLPGRMAIGAPADTGPQQVDQSKSEIATRKAALATAAAAAAMQRKVETEADRSNRLGDAQARKAREMALPSNADANKAKTGSAPLPTMAALAAAPAPTANLSAEDAAPGVSMRANAKRLPSQGIEHKSGELSQAAPRLAAAPTRAPPPRFVAPYAVRRVVVSAPQSAYAPQPTRWTRTIFNDINRMR